MTVPFTESLGVGHRVAEVTRKRGCWIPELILSSLLTDASSDLNGKTPTVCHDSTNLCKAAILDRKDSAQDVLIMIIISLAATFKNSLTPVIRFIRELKRTC